MRTPQEAVEQLLMEAPDAAWLRGVADALDRHLRLQSLERLQKLWGLSDTEASKMFGVSSQTMSRWRRQGVPSKHTPALADFSTATDALDHYTKRERIPVIVRRHSIQLGASSLYDLACTGRHDEIRGAVKRMFDLGRVQP